MSRTLVNRVGTVIRALKGETPSDLLEGLALRLIAKGYMVMRCPDAGEEFTTDDGRHVVVGPYTWRSVTRYIDETIDGDAGEWWETCNGAGRRLLMLRQVFERRPDFVEYYDGPPRDLPAEP